MSIEHKTKLNFNRIEMAIDISVAKMFTCDICHQIPLTPYQCGNKNCKRIVCLKCHHGTCSICHSNYEIEPLNYKLQAIFDNLEFRCQNYSIGCKEIISVDNYEEHYSSCVNDKLLEEFKAFFKGEMERKYVCVEQKEILTNMTPIKNDSTVYESNNSSEKKILNVKINRQNNSGVKKNIFKITKDIKNISNSKESFLELEQQSKKLLSSHGVDKLNFRNSQPLNILVPDKKPPRVRKYDQNYYSGGYGFKKSRNSTRGGINFIL